MVPRCDVWCSSTVGEKIANFPALNIFFSWYGSGPLCPCRSNKISWVPSG